MTFTKKLDQNLISVLSQASQSAEMLAKEILAINQISLQKQVPPPIMNQPIPNPPPSKLPPPPPPPTPKVLNAVFFKPIVRIMTNEVRKENLEDSIWGNLPKGLVDPMAIEDYRNEFCVMTSSSDQKPSLIEKKSDLINFLGSSGRAYARLVSSLAMRLRRLGIKGGKPPSVNQSIDFVANMLVNLDKSLLDIDQEIPVPTETELESAIKSVDDLMGLKLPLRAEGSVAEHDLATILGPRIDEYGNGERFLMRLSGNLSRVRVFVNLIRTRRKLLEAFGFMGKDVATMLRAFQLMSTNWDMAKLLISAREFQSKINEFSRSRVPTNSLTIQSLLKYCQVYSPKERTVNLMSLLVRGMPEDVKRLVDSVEANVDFDVVGKTSVGNLKEVLNQFAKEAKDGELFCSTILPNTPEDDEKLRGVITHFCNTDFVAAKQVESNLRANVAALENMELNMVKFYGEQPVFKVNEIIQIPNDKNKEEKVEPIPTTNRDVFLDIIADIQDYERFSQFKRGTIYFFQILRSLIECLDNSLSRRN